MSILKRGGRPAPVDWLIVGLGNPGRRYVGTRHNVGAKAVARLVEEHDLGRAKDRWGGRFVDGRLGPGGPRIGVLIPDTFMNESGRAVGPARGELRVEPDHVIVVHDEIDFPFGRVESKLGGGHGGHNGLRSIKQALGTGDFRRVRVGVGRPDTTDPEIVSSWVLGRFGESDQQVDELVGDAIREVLRITSDA